LILPSILNIMHIDNVEILLHKQAQMRRKRGDEFRDRVREGVRLVFKVEKRARVCSLENQSEGFKK
jgi:hypothetical protein